MTFNAEKWIEKNSVLAAPLNDESLAAAKNFLLMWNLFEKVLCKTRANKHRFERLVEENRDNLFFFERHYQFFRERYTDGVRGKNRWDGLNWRNNDDEPRMRKILEDQDASIREKSLLVLMIVYRIRNNLFHGMKSLSSLNKQWKLLNRAAEILADCLVHFQNDLFRTQETIH